MSEQDNELQGTSNLDAGQAEELDLEELKAKAAKADEYKGFADRVTAENKELKKKLEPQENLPTNKSFSESERDLIVDLRLEGYSKTEADFILRNGGRKALEDPLVTAAIESSRAKAKSVEATPSGTGKSTVYQKYTEQDLKKMSASDLEKIVPQD